MGGCFQLRLAGSIALSSWFYTHCCLFILLLVGIDASTSSATPSEQSCISRGMAFLGSSYHIQPRKLRSLHWKGRESTLIRVSDRCHALWKWLSVICSANFSIAWRTFNFLSSLVNELDFRTYFFCFASCQIHKNNVQTKLMWFLFIQDFQQRNKCCFYFCLVLIEPTSSQYPQCIHKSEPEGINTLLLSKPFDNNDDKTTVGNKSSNKR